MQFLFFSGIVRGSIAFALVLKLNGNLPNREVIVTTSLMIVVVTTLIFGSAMPFMSRLFLEEEESESPKKKIKDKELKNISESLSEHEPF